MIQVFINNVDYTKYIENGSLSVEDQLNQTSQCTFSLVNVDDHFVFPARESYVKVFSNQYNKLIFTGFISAFSQKDFVGLNNNTPTTNFQTYRYSVTCASDEY